MLHSPELEKQLLAYLIKQPESFVSICSSISEKDFFSKDSQINACIFTIIRHAAENAEQIDDIIISQRIASLGITFEDNISVGDYIKSLGLRKVSENGIEKIARELKKYTVRREITENAHRQIKEMKNISSERSVADIIAVSDKIHNSSINMYDDGDDTPQNIYDDMEMLIEERGENPITEFGLMGPYPKLNQMYGSLLRPGNITVFVARAGVGKSTLAMDYSTKVAETYDVPVLHFDNGEMSKEELITRQCAALSGVPMHLIETGKWRTSGAEIVEKIRGVWKRVQKIKPKFFYHNVGGAQPDEMTNILKRFYYNKIGRGKPMIFSFDYIKSPSGSGDNNWLVVGEMVDKFKRLISKEIRVDGKPIIPMITSVQANRSGITNGRKSSDVVDDESIVSLSDQITHFASHMFVLRKKTLDEIAEHGDKFGTHRLTCTKHRHLGEDIRGALEPIKYQDRLERNFVNFEFKNFAITEKGDLRDIVEAQKIKAELEQSPQVGPAPF